MSIIYKLNNRNSDEIISKTSNILLNKGLIVYPTDTIYGIGTIFGNIEGEKLITKIKSRNATKNFIYLANNIDMVLNFTNKINNEVIEIMKYFWPGPLTLILPTKKNSIAFRVPKNNFCLNLIKKINLPISSTSVNLSGNEPINDVKEIKTKFINKVDLIIDSGKINTKTPSTILDCTKSKIKIIREGELFEDVLKFISKYEK